LKEKVALVSRERCIRQLVLIVVKKLKFLSNRKKVDQSTVENAIKSIDQRDSNPGLSFD
jgi:hypothetical protein